VGSIKGTEESKEQNEVHLLFAANILHRTPANIISGKT
jgi:hypothetical protein